tara:strand:- start:2175 stop:3218 length:1044 start_codon:yes stop_codon:yes gene_type:complete
MIEKEFWKNKNVVITGHSGFKGFWMALLLNELGSKVHGVSLKNNSSQIYKIHSEYEKLLNETFFDIRDEVKVNSYLNEIKPDIIFHLAAQSLVISGQLNPKKTLETNIIGTFNVLNWSTKAKSKVSTVVATTDKVYKNPNKKNTEDDELGSFEFYGASKVGAENVINAFNLDPDTKNKVSVVRSGNVLGGGDGGENRLLTDLISAIKNNENILLRNPNSIRPWQFVLDSVGGYLLVAQDNFKSSSSEIYNLNLPESDEVTVLELTNKLIKKFNSNIEIEIIENKKYNEAPELRLDSNKAQNNLNWKNIYSIDSIIENIYEWEASKNIEEIYSITKNQIGQYLEKTIN